jgi:hypothetical protein
LPKSRLTKYLFSPIRDAQICRLYLWGVIIPPGGGVLEPERMVSVIGCFLFILNIIEREKIKNNGFFL